LALGRCGADAPHPGPPANAPPLANPPIEGLDPLRNTPPPTEPVAPAPTPISPASPVAPRLTPIPNSPSGSIKLAGGTSFRSVWLHCRRIPLRKIYSKVILDKRSGGLPFAGLVHAKGGLRVCAYANQPQTRYWPRRPAFHYLPLLSAARRIGGLASAMLFAPNSLPSRFAPRQGADGRTSTRVQQDRA
jgi:hypothetical protein